MKKTLILAIILIATITASLAQPRAIGGRLGYGMGVSYQHGFGEKNMLQVDLDIPCYFWGAQGTVTYNWIFPIKSWNKAGSWNWYAGVGGGVGYLWGWEGYRWRWKDNYLWIGKSNGNLLVGVAGMIGVEYNFKFPLQLSLDYRPLVGPVLYFSRSNAGAGFNYLGLWASSVAFGIRYNFGK